MGEHGPATWGERTRAVATAGLTRMRTVLFSLSLSLSLSLSPFLPPSLLPPSLARTAAISTGPAIAALFADVITVEPVNHTLFKNPDVACKLF